MHSAETSESYRIIQMIASIIEGAGIFAIVLGGIVSTFNYFRNLAGKNPRSYEEYRGSFGRAILLGLEILVAGDIIGTIAAEPTFASLGVLAIIVIIRTFLSFSLEVEIKGRWPWQNQET
jgi:uncharacterized membrane protein